MEVLYCGVCGLPPEYCEFNKNFDKCKIWIAKNCPEVYPDLKLDEIAAELEETKIETKEEPKEVKNKKNKNQPEVLIYSEQRNKRKFITSIYGLQFFGIFNLIIIFFI